MKQTKSLKARAFDLLSRREYTRRELERKLAPHSQSEEELEQVLDSLAKDNWQSDQRFAEQWVMSRGQRYGTARLKQSMQQKGVSSEQIQTSLSEHDDLKLAQHLWSKKFGTRATTPQESQKQLRFLLTRGIPPSIAFKIVRSPEDFEDFFENEDF